MCAIGIKLIALDINNNNNKLYSGLRRRPYMQITNHTNEHTIIIHIEEKKKQKKQKLPVITEQCDSRCNH